MTSSSLQLDIPARRRVLDAIENHVVANRWIEFQTNGAVQTVLNDGTRTSLDPKTRDLWVEYDALSERVS